MTSRTREHPLVFNAFEMAGVGYYAQGAWSHPRSQRHRYTELSFWTERARQLEAGFFDAMFFADVLGVYDTYQGSPDPAIRGAVDFPLADPLLLIPAMAAVTEHLGFAVTASTTYEQPFSHARRFTTLDHLTDGRIAWNVVTSYLPNAARNFGYTAMMSHEERYGKAEEFLEVVYALWEGSWEDDAVRYDKAATIYADPGKVHRIDHSGRYFSVQGPALVEPSAQRTPVIYQAGASSRGRSFAARHAEAVFVNGTNRNSLRDNVTAIRTEAVKAGREATDVVVLTDLSVVIGRTHGLAERKADEIRAAQSSEAALAAFSGASGFDLAAYGPDDVLGDDPGQHSQSESARFTTERSRPDTIADITRQLTDLSPYAATLVGTPAEIADDIADIVEHTGVDGFNLHEFVTPEDFGDFIEHVVPILQKRGLYRTSFEEGTLRRRLHHRGDRVRDTHPAAGFRNLAARQRADS